MKSTEIKNAIDIRKIGAAHSGSPLMSQLRPNYVQPDTTAPAAVFAANTSDINDDTATFDGYTLGQIVRALRNLGVLA
jgi:hypothetical protein